MLCHRSSIENFNGLKNMLPYQKYDLLRCCSMRFIILKIPEKNYLLIGYKKSKWGNTSDFLLSYLFRCILTESGKMAEFQSFITQSRLLIETFIKVDQFSCRI